MTEALVQELDLPRKRGARPSRRSRWLRRTGNVLIVLAVLLGAYAAVIVIWGDPITAYYEQRQQAHLAHVLDTAGASFVTHERVPARAPLPAAQLMRVADAWQGQLRPGLPVGRLVIRKLGVSQVVVQGTGTGDLQHGPGHYATTSLPGLGRVTAVAGHRTTFGAPFRHIDNLAAGDTITFQLPYGTFLYRVTSHRVVRSNDWSIIKPHGFDELVLTACHPLYSASHRWVVFARLAAVYPKESHL